MAQRKSLPILAALSAAAALSMADASAQTQSGSTGTAGASTVPSTLSPAGKLQRADRGLLRDIAQANLAEVATGKLALEKSQNAEVKKFAQTMVDDHSAALQDVGHLARIKAMQLPQEPDLKHKAAMKAMQALDGERFDKLYISQAGVGDHRKTRELLQKTQANAKDADLKALAEKMLPVVERHLAHAEQMAGK
jgi:putative membrane protein